MNTEKRSSGILMHISSLPSPYGIGTLGKSAFDFVDFLHKSKVSLWQMLPLGVTNYGDSPYQSPSAKGLNYYFLDLDILVQKKLLLKSEIDSKSFGTDPTKVDYGMMFQSRIPLLKKAFARFDIQDKEFIKFEKEGQFRDFAFYMTLKAMNGYKPWYDWPEEIRHYSFVIEQRIIKDYKKDYLFYVWTQFEFLNQYLAVKEYANKQGISIIGDMPLYLSRDSVEAYKYPEMFLFDKNQNPTLVAGCPPDAFSDDGQLWGNPIYNWDFMAGTGYKWFNARIDFNLKIFDILRIDHFRGLAGYYVIPFGLKNARIGMWRDGPAFALFHDKTEMPIIAEDLGFIDQPVIDLLRDTGYPGMKILEFAFDGHEDNEHKPSNYKVNSVCYTGTHDNETLLGYLQNMESSQLEVLKKDLSEQCLLYKVSYNGETLEQLVRTIVALCYASPSFLSVLPIQDLLIKDNSCRMNHPSTLGSNWTYRTLASDFTTELAKNISSLVTEYKRN